MTTSPFDTDFAEIPAIMVGGQVTLVSPKMLSLPRSVLKELANTHGGRLVYVKRRIVYEELEVAMCCHEGCWRPATGALFCSDHPSEGEERSGEGSTNGN
jgi:hypothetical protein